MSQINNKNKIIQKMLAELEITSDEINNENFDFILQQFMEIKSEDYIKTLDKNELMVMRISQQGFGKNFNVIHTHGFIDWFNNWVTCSA